MSQGLREYRESKNVNKGIYVPSSVAHLREGEKDGISDLKDQYMHDPVSWAHNEELFGSIKGLRFVHDDATLAVKKEGQRPIWGEGTSIVCTRVLLRIKSLLPERLT